MLGTGASEGQVRSAHANRRVQLARSWLDRASENRSCTLNVNSGIGRVEVIHLIRWAGGAQNPCHLTPAIFTPASTQDGQKWGDLLL